MTAVPRFSIASDTVCREECHHLAKAYVEGNYQYDKLHCSYVLKALVCKDALGEELDTMKTLWQTEVRIIRKLNDFQAELSSRFVPLFYDAWMCTESGQTFFYIVIERFYGNIYDFVRKHKRNKLCLPYAMKVLELCTLQLRMIHKDCGICLNDVHPGNILFKKTDYGYTFVFSDFGAAMEGTTEKCQMDDTELFMSAIRYFRLRAGPMISD